MITLIIVIGTWLVSGTTGFIYWWTRQHNYTNKDICLSLFVSIIGPLAWIVGKNIHSDRPIHPFVYEDGIIIKQRNLK